MQQQGKTLSDARGQIENLRANKTSQSYALKSSDVQFQNFLSIFDQWSSYSKTHHEGSANQSNLSESSLRKDKRTREIIKPHVTPEKLLILEQQTTFTNSRRERINYVT